jgi:hypothetical protein
MDKSGLLAIVGGRIWSVLDVQFVVLLLVVLPMTLGDSPGREKSGLSTAAGIISALILLNFLVGYLRLGGLRGVLNITRLFMTFPVFFAAANILSTPENVKKFYKWLMWFTFLVLVIHFLLMLRIYVPHLYSAAYERQEMWKGMTLARSTLYLFEPFYIVSASVSLCYLLYKGPNKILSICCLSAAGIGTLATQARGMYGGLFLVFMGVALFVKGHVKKFVIFGLIGIILFGGVSYAAIKGIDLFARFRGGLQRQGYFDTIRGKEFLNLYNSFKQTPTAILTGQGFGVTHEGTGAKDRRGYFHNDYFGALFSLGLIGFACYCYIMFSCIFRGRKYCNDPEFALLIMPVRLVFFSLAGYAFLNQTFWLNKGTGFLIIIAAISRNSDYLVSQLYFGEDSGEDMYIDESNFIDHNQFDFV